MAATLPKFVTRQYTPPGVFIGQLVRPSVSNFNADARLPVYIGQGSRFAKGGNLPLRRAFVTSQALAFPSVAPFRATLAFAADGDQRLAKLFQQDGTEVRKDLWRFEKDLSNSFTKILVQSEIFDPNVTYLLDYQSVDRTVKDPVPVQDLRQISLMGTQQDQPQFNEFKDYFIEMSFTGPIGALTNANAQVLIETPVGVVVAGGGTVTIDVSASYSHAYNRYYTVKVLAISGVSGSFTATVEWTAKPVSGGNNGAPGVPLNSAQPAPQFIVDQTILASQVVELELGVKLKFTFGATNFSINDQWDINALGSALYEMDERLLSSNQFVDQGTPSSNGTNAGTGAFTSAPDANFNGLLNTHYRLQAYNATNLIATGSLVAVAKASLVTGETFTIGATTFQFDITGSDGIAAGNSAIDVSAVTTDVDVANAMRIAINAALLGVTASGATSTVTLTADNPGVVGNLVVTDTVADVSFVSTTLTGGDRTASIAWQEFGNSTGVDGNFVATESNTSTLTQTLNKGVKLDVQFGAFNFAVNDSFSVDPKAPRLFTTIKDNRTYTLTTNTTTASLNAGAVSGSFVTNTPEGSFGSFVADTATAEGSFELPGNIKLSARNLFKIAASGFENRHSASDTHSLVITNEELVIWDLTTKESESFNVADLLFDQNGTVTGIVGATYAILQADPIAGSVKVTAPTTAPSFGSIPNSPFIFFLTAPTETISVTYDTIGAEPDPGQLYFMTASFLRPDNLYNVPLLVSSLDEGRKLLSPSTLNNHLFIMNEIAWKNSPTAVYFIQVKDNDDDGVFTNVDFNEALLASEGKSNITDRIVLAHYNSVSDQLAVNVRANNPLEKRESLDWFGVPIGTPVGDIDTTDSIVFTAQKTLQVFGNSPAHGTRVLVASSTAKTSIRLDTGETKQVTLDGSFVAGAVAALVASFNDPATTILRKVLFGFDEIEVFTDKQNILLGGAQTVFFSDEGAGVFRMQEDVTVDSLALDFKLIAGMTQKQLVTRVFRRELDKAVISFVVPTGQVGVDVIQGASAQILLGLLGQGLIAPYQDAKGNQREFSPSQDVIVTRNTEDPTRFDLLFAYFIKSDIKRVFGLFSVNPSSPKDLTEGIPLNS